MDNRGTEKQRVNQAAVDAVMERRKQAAAQARAQRRKPPVLKKKSSAADQDHSKRRASGQREGYADAEALRNSSGQSRNVDSGQKQVRRSAQASERRGMRIDADSGQREVRRRELTSEQREARKRKLTPEQTEARRRGHAPVQTEGQKSRLTPEQREARKKKLTPEQAARRRELAKRRQKKRKRAKRRKKILALFLTFMVLYCVAVFSNIPFIAKWRTIYIETAMSTKTHQWLATAFIPGWIVDDVVAETEKNLNAQENLSSEWTLQITTGDEFYRKSYVEQFYELYFELDTESGHAYIDSHYNIEQDGYDNILIEDFDKELGITTPQGDPILVVDTANNLLIVDVSDTDYRAKMAIVKDTNQVDLVTSKTFGSFGQEAEAFGEENGALIVINASRFQDVGGHGNGGTVKGALVIDGKQVGHPKRGFWRYAGVTPDNKLDILSFREVKPSHYKWGLEVYPALIVNGEIVIDGTTGMGIQPRTSIGQTERGDFMLLIVDGRQVGYSLGCTVADCADILKEYNVYQALNLDGGSSTVMWYRGRLITKPCSVSGRGRYMPDAIIVRPAADVQDTSTETSTNTNENKPVFGTQQ